MNLYFFLNTLIILLLSAGLFSKNFKTIFFLLSVLLISFNILIFSHSSAQDHVVTMNSFEQDDFFFEPLFTIITKVLYLFLPSEFVLAATFLFVSITAFALIERNLKNVLFVILLLQFQTGLISVRIFLAIIIGGLAIFSLSKIKKYTAAVAAPLFHSATIIILPIVILDRLKNFQSFIYFLAVIFFIIILIGEINIRELLVNFALYIGRDYSYYLSAGIGSDGALSIFSIIKFLLPIIFILICTRFQINVFLFLAIFAFLIKVLLWEFEPLSRITNTLLIISVCYLTTLDINKNLASFFVLFYCLALNFSLFFESDTVTSLKFYFEGLSVVF